MGIPLMIQPKDNLRIEMLKKNFNIHKKIDVIRAGLDLLEQEAKRIQKTHQWKNATKLVAKSSHKVNLEFQKNSRLRRYD